MTGWRWVGRLAVVAVLLGGVSVCAQPTDDGVLIGVKKSRIWTRPQRFGPGGVLALLFVDAGRNQMAVVVEGPRRPDELPPRLLSFYSRKGGQLVETHRFTTPNSFVAMHPTIDRTRLITTWASGSAYRTGIFALDKRNVRLVLWLGWKLPPEFVDLDGDGEEEVIHAIDGFAGAEPDKADIYKWTGRDYQLIRRVPWSARYERK